jgi:UPF0755 protein
MARKRRSGLFKRARRVFTCCVFFPLLVVGGGALWVRQQLSPVSSTRRPSIVVIDPGIGAPGIAARLEKAGVVRNATAFLWYARLSGHAGDLKAGEYRLSPDMTPDQILERLKRGGADSEEIAVTIPEGFTAKRIAETLAGKGVIADKAAFLRLAEGKGAHPVAPFNLPSGGLEGYLYPDTYRFLPKTAPEKAVQAMVDNFTKAFFDRNRAAIEQSGHNLQEIVTIASLIEREAEVPRDRARIAGVIENRLRRNMKLDIDATVLYALGRHKDRVLYADLKVDSPYNTYRRKGLPPGPIASPGLASLEAALNPERHDFLYYVAAPDGSHVFTRTLAEHNTAVARMRALRQNGSGNRNG